ncbi:MAG: HlyD family secretion protein [Candidatus Gastranaerophilales bacterium]
MDNNKQIENNEEKQPNKKPFKRIIGLVLLAVIIIICTVTINDSMKYQSTDDAYVETTTVQVSPKVSGQIIEVFVKDNQFINEGDVVAKIDPTDYEVKLAQIEARYERALSNQKNANAQYASAQINIDTAKKDYDRYKNLYEQGAVSKQVLDGAEAKYISTKAHLVQAEEGLFSEAKTKVADADLKELEALKKQAELYLSYTDVIAPQSGTVTNRRVEKGMFVQTGSPLFVTVPEQVWVVANFKENQVGEMKKGQKVEIKVDTYPDKVFIGEVDSIQRSSGAKSSLFPPENAVGSFVKIVQRIPVKIVFSEDIDTDKYTIVPGMSVVPKVKIK